MPKSTKSMFVSAREKREARKVDTFHENSIYPIVKSETLLSSIQRKKLTNDIKKLAAAPEEHYQVLYNQLINNFADFVQVLPVNNEARLGSLLDEGLLRALFALQIFKGKKQGEEIEPLMNYVMFSAALLFDISSAIEDRSIIISDRDGAFIKQWYPHEGVMRVTDGYYKIRRGGGYPPWLCRRATPSFARQIIPEIGFSWIAKDQHAFDTWIALLNYEREAAGEFTMFFDRALELLEEFKTQQEFYKFPVDVEEITPKETELAEDFIEWLKEALEKGELSINKTDSDLHKVDEGLFVNIKDLFKKYGRHAGGKALYGAVDLAELINQLMKLGLTNGITRQYFFRHVTRATRPSTGIFQSSALFQGMRSAEAQQVMAQAQEVTAEAAAKVAEAARITEAKPEQVLSAGGRLEGVVVHYNLVEGFVPPAIAYPSIGINANIRPVDAAAQNLPEKYPDLTAQQEAAQSVTPQSF